MAQTQEEIRREQIAEGRKQTLTLPPGAARPAHDPAHVSSRTSRPFGASKSYTPAAKSKHIPKGHDAILAELQASGQMITIEMTSGVTYKGQVLGRDKFTISIKPFERADPAINAEEKFTEGAAPRVLYKHAIEGFDGVLAVPKS